eukprot:m.181382 g.181382  ORF g.181382 m.181382 type:complete len:94 (+) comp16628_c4_seq1:472-753(+)
MKGTCELEPRTESKMRHKFFSISEDVMELLQLYALQECKHDLCSFDGSRFSAEVTTFGMFLDETSVCITTCIANAFDHRQSERMATPSTRTGL